MAHIRLLNPADPAVKTFGLRAPKETHTRSASCEEVGCQNYIYGFRISLDKAIQHRLIKDVRDSGRPFQENEDGGVIHFIFASGTKCFAAHTVSLEREPLYVVRDLNGGRKHTKPEHWVEEFAENQIKLVEKIQEG